MPLVISFFTADVMRPLVSDAFRGSASSMFCRDEEATDDVWTGDSFVFGFTACGAVGGGGAEIDSAAEENAVPAGTGAAIEGSWSGAGVWT